MKNIKFIVKTKSKSYQIYFGSGIFIFNGVLKWNYAHGSNLYIVYTARKSVNGKKFPKISDFFQYNKEGRWVETLRDQTIMVKIDYWFEM